MAILGGSGGWSPSSDFLLEQFSQPDFKALKLHRLPRGMDNARIDVLLDKDLVYAVRDLVAAHLYRHLKGSQVTEGSVRELQDAAARFEEMHAAGTLTSSQLSRSKQSREHAQLYQLAVVKLICTQIDSSIQELREGKREPAMPMRSDVSPSQMAAGLTTAAAWSQLRYAIAHDMMRILHRAEGGALRKLRKSVLGISWPVSESMLFTPLLELGDLESEQAFLENYPLCLRKPDNLKLINTALVSVLAEWLPEYCSYQPVQLQTGDYRSLPTRRDKGDLAGFVKVEELLKAFVSPTEYQEGHYCWLDEADNVLALFGADKEPWPVSGPWRHSSFQAFQKGLASQMEKALHQAGLGDELYASLIMPDLCNRVRLHTALTSAYQYLSGKLTKRAIQQSIQNTKQIINPVQVVEQLEQARKQVRAASGQPWQLARLLRGFARLRADLKLSWELYRNLDMIRLIDDDQDILLSRSNGLLHEFNAGGGGSAEAKVRGHVIIKADLRGSTTLTSSMIAQGLNPAAYFSQNLFDPINRLLDRFGAEKVFVEGDAVILILLEHSGHQQDSLVVARACGLAYHMLDVVKQRNHKNRHLKLPELELGIGIAYIDEAPNYLFDEGHKITISPAINRADRLSSCASGLHEAKLGMGRNGWGVEEVMQVGANLEEQMLSPQDFIKRYNVNGIELDLPAFGRLSEELVLRKVKQSSLGGGKSSRFHVGRFPDAQGHTEWLLIREAQVRLWDGQAYLEGRDLPTRFFEVVSDSKLIDKLRTKLSSAEKLEEASEGNAAIDTSP